MRTGPAIVLWMVSLTILAPVSPLGASRARAAEMQMWSCAVMGQRRPVLYLAERGARSYIKFQGQRIAARHEIAGEEHKWVFGGNWVVLKGDGVAEYYQAGVKQGVFKCKSSGG